MGLYEDGLKISRDYIRGTIHMGMELNPHLLFDDTDQAVDEIAVMTLALMLQGKELITAFQQAVSLYWDKLDNS